MTLFLACGQSGGQPKPTRVWHGAATESLCGLWVEKQKQRTKSQKARQERERLREREMRLVMFGENNHSSERRADVKEKKTRICLCVTFGLLLFFLNPDDELMITTFRAFVI